MAEEHGIKQGRGIVQYKLPLTGPTAKTIPGQKKPWQGLRYLRQGAQKARNMDWTSLGHDNEVVLRGVCIRHIGIWHHAKHRDADASCLIPPITVCSKTLGSFSTMILSFEGQEMATSARAPKRGGSHFGLTPEDVPFGATCCLVCAGTAWAVLVAIFYLEFAASLMRSLSSIESPRVGRCFRGTTERLDTNTSEGRYHGGVTFAVPPCQEAP